MSINNNFSINIKFTNHKVKCDLNNKCFPELLLHHNDTSCIVITSVNLDSDVDIVKEAAAITNPIYKTLYSSGLWNSVHVAMDNNPEFFAEGTTDKKVSFYPDEITRISYTFNGEPIVETSLYITENTTINH
jgi:hypothetical protein